MSNIYNVFGFTGKVWEIPKVDTISTSTLLDTYSDIFYTLEDNGTYYLGTRDTINKTLGGSIALYVLQSTPLTIAIKSPVDLIESKWKLVMDGKESNGTIHFPSNEKIVINGGQFIPTDKDGEQRYVTALADNMSTYTDPIIGSSNCFYDCELHEITNETLTEHYQNGLLLVGGILLRIRDYYSYLGTGVNLNSGISGWLPTLYKKVAEHIEPYQCGLEWPIVLSSLQTHELWNRLLSNDSSFLIAFNTPGPVSYEKFPISRLFPSLIDGILCYDDRPSPERVIERFKHNRAPTKNALYPVYQDINDLGTSAVTINYIVKDVAPEQHVIKYINYEVL